MNKSGNNPVVIRTPQRVTATYATRTSTLDGSRVTMNGIRITTATLNVKR